MYSVLTRMLIVFCAAGLVAFSATGADNDNKNNSSNTTYTETPMQTTTTITGIPSESPNPAAVIQKGLQNDPLLKNLRVRVDLYKGLAIVHGAAPTEQTITVITNRLRSTQGIEAVFNYMLSPAKQHAEPADIAVSYDDFQRMEAVGVQNNAFTIGQRVKTRLDADPVLQPADLSVDTYKNLVILHGTLRDQATAQRAKDIAAYTEGVEAVLSYIDVGSQPEMAPVTAAPILVRPMVVDVTAREVIPAQGCARSCP